MSPFELSPELRALLGEVAADPQASALRNHLGESIARGPRHPTSAALLADAEQRLLEVLRDETARWLYQQAHLTNLKVDEDYVTFVHWGDDQSQPEDRPCPLSAELDASRVDPELPGVLARREPAEMLAIALRMAPSDSIRIALGITCARAGQHARSEELLVPVCDSGDRLMASYAFENLAYLRTREFASREAARNYERALEADPTRVIPALSWLRFSLWALDREGALRARSFIDQHIRPDHAGVLWYARTYVPDLTIPSPVLDLARELARGAGEVSGSVMLGMAGTAGVAPTAEGLRKP